MTWRKQAMQKEEETLSSFAARSCDHQRELGPEDDHRLPYKRDVDRIVHSRAYCRYHDKTQVVYLVPNDHITHRVLHVNLVSHFARGIAEILHLNLDLVEAIALGHDVGHPPFGHEGEQYLSALSIEYGNGPFAHPWQSCRLFRTLEPLHLGLAVYDGFLCHDGGMTSRRHRPNFGKTWEDHFRELAAKKDNPDLDIAPGTLEGCLVKICDTASYVGRDIEDALRLGLISREQIPKTILGTANREILSHIAQDLLRNSYGQGEIVLSEEVFAALHELRTFNFQYIYHDPHLKVESQKIERSYRILFETLLSDSHARKEKSHLWQHFLYNKSQAYLDETSPVAQVVDYIAGMTDRYFVRTLETLVLPQQIALKGGVC